MNLLDFLLVGLSIATAVALIWRARTHRESGGCGGAGGKTDGVSTTTPAPCAGCQSAVRRTSSALR